MRTQRLLAAVSLLWLLGACQVSPGAQQVNLSGDLASGDADSNNSDSNNSDSKSAANCEKSTAAIPLEGFAIAPLATPPDMPVFEQFNFQPQEIAVTDSTVAVKTPYYTFSFCQGDRTWNITSIPPAPAEEYDYERDLAEIADPPFQKIEANGNNYEYRIRLQAEWLNAELNLSEETPTSETPSGSAPSDAVFFELKTPDGELISRQLYTLNELQTAGLGASLGSPQIAGAVAIGEEIWFAASASQGEGDSGFASLLRYSLPTQSLTVDRPEEIQGDQIVAIAATENRNQPLTLWLGTLRSGEGNPALPASGLVAYQPDTKAINRYSVSNSPIIGAIPYQLAATDDSLWVGTGNGVCEVQWQTIEQAQSWDCWRFMAAAALPQAGLKIYPSSLADQPAGTLSDAKAEVLWASQEPVDSLETEPTSEAEPETLRYEVVYEPGFEARLAQGGYRLDDEVTQQMAESSPIFWPGREWHWSGDRFVRGFDEVAVNLVGGGPWGLSQSSSDGGPSFDHSAIRGDFDLLNLSAEETQVRYYSGWVEGAELEVYPEIVAVASPLKEQSETNPLIEIAADLPASPGP
jgi:hypothetical protein